MEEIEETVKEKNYYDILGVNQNATNDQIEQAWKKLKVKYHPDQSDTGDVDLFREVQDAYNVLIDEQKREKYDDKLKNGSTVYCEFFPEGAGDTNDANSSALIVREQVDLFELLRNAKLGTEKIAELFADKPDIIIALLTNRRILEDEEIKGRVFWPLVLSNLKVAGYVAKNDILLNFLYKDFDLDDAAGIDAEVCEYLELDEEEQQELKSYMSLCDAIKQKHPELFEKINSNDNNNNEDVKEHEQAKVELSPEEKKQDRKIWNKLLALRGNEITSKVICNLLNSMKYCLSLDEYRKLLLKNKALIPVFVRIKGAEKCIRYKDLPRILKHCDSAALYVIHDYDWSEAREANQLELYRQLAIHCSDEVAKDLITDPTSTFIYNNGETLHQILEKHPKLLQQMLQIAPYRQALTSYQKLLAIVGQNDSKLSDAPKSDTSASIKPGPGYENYCLGEAFYSNNDIKNAVFTWLSAMTEGSFEAYLALGRLLGSDNDEYEELIQGCAMQYLHRDYLDVLVMEKFYLNLLRFVINQLTIQQKVEDDKIGDRVFQATVIYVLEKSKDEYQRVTCAYFLAQAAKECNEPGIELQFLFELEKLAPVNLEQDDWQKMADHLMSDLHSKDDHFERLEKAAPYYAEADDQKFFDALRKDHLEKSSVSKGEKLSKEKQQYIDRLLAISPIANRLTADEFFELQKLTSSYKTSVEAYKNFKRILKNLKITNTKELDEFEDAIEEFNADGYFEHIMLYRTLFNGLADLYDKKYSPELLEKVFSAVKEDASWNDDDDKEKKVFADNIDDLINELVDVYRLKRMSCSSLIYAWHSIKCLGRGKHLYYESFFEDENENDTKHVEAVLAGSDEACFDMKLSGSVDDIDLLELLDTPENIYNFFQVAFRVNNTSLIKFMRACANRDGNAGQFVAAHACAIEYQRVGKEAESDKYFKIAHSADDKQFTTDNFMGMARYFLVKPIEELANLLSANDFASRVTRALWYLEKAVELGNEEAQEHIEKIEIYRQTKEKIGQSKSIFSAKHCALGYDYEMNAMIQLAENISELLNVGVAVNSNAIIQTADKLSTRTNEFLKKTPDQRRDTAGKFRCEMMAELNAIAPELEKAKAIPIVKNIGLACALLLLGYVIAVLANRYSSIGNGRWGFFAKTNSKLKVNDFENAFNAGYQDNNLVMV